MTDSTGSATLATSETTLEAIRALHELGGARLMEVVEHLDRPPSTLYAHLETLRELRFVVVEDGRYDLGPEFVKYGEYAKNRKPAYERAARYTEELNEATGLRTIFVVEAYDRGYIFHTEAGAHAEYDHERPGNWLPLHATAVGKAILAEFSETRLDRFLETTEPGAKTENTLSSPAELRAELAEIRERGVAFNRGENIEGLSAAGAAVENDDGSVLGAFSVSGPTPSLQGDRLESEIPEVLTRVVNEFELELSLS